MIWDLETCCGWFTRFSLQLRWFRADWSVAVVTIKFLFLLSALEFHSIYKRTNVLHQCFLVLWSLLLIAYTFMVYPCITVGLNSINYCIIPYPLLCSFFNYFVAYWRSTVPFRFLSRWLGLSLDFGRFKCSNPTLRALAASNDISVHKGKWKLQLFFSNISFAAQFKDDIRQPHIGTTIGFFI